MVVGAFDHSSRVVLDAGHQCWGRALVNGSGCSLLFVEDGVWASSPFIVRCWAIVNGMGRCPNQ